jgi:transcription elongation factor Elf1
MSWLEEKYIGLMSGRLRNFKRRGPGRYSFSCPICGDSESDKRKARGNIYTKQGRLMFHCFNCSASTNVPNLIKSIDASLYSEYSIERLREEKSPQQVELEEFVMKMKTPVFMSSGPLRGLKKVSQLSPDDPIKKYVDSRRIPNPYHAKMFKCPNFFAWVNEVVPGKFETSALTHDETRLLIPFLGKDKMMHAFQGRSLSVKSRTKYITVVNDETQPKLYGLDAVDLSKTTYVMEGPIDSMFINNSIATAGGDLVSSLSPLNSSKSSLVVVYDNEPRSVETIKKIDKAIMQGYSVCIWPDNLEHKDVNDMVMAGLTSEFIQYIIDQNTVRDLQAKLALQRWRRA